MGLRVWKATTVGQPRRLNSARVWAGGAHRPGGRPGMPEPRRRPPADPVPAARALRDGRRQWCGTPLLPRRRGCARTPRRRGSLRAPNRPHHAAQYRHRSPGPWPPRRRWAGRSATSKERRRSLCMVDDAFVVSTPHEAGDPRVCTVGDEVRVRCRGGEEKGWARRRGGRMLGGCVHVAIDQRRGMARIDERGRGPECNWRDVRRAWCHHCRVLNLGCCRCRCSRLAVRLSRPRPDRWRAVRPIRDWQAGGLSLTTRGAATNGLHDDATPCDQSGRECASTASPAREARQDSLNIGGVSRRQTSAPGILEFTSDPQGLEPAARPVGIHDERLRLLGPAQIQFVEKAGEFSDGVGDQLLVGHPQPVRVPRRSVLHGHAEEAATTHSRFRPFPRTLSSIRCRSATAVP
jgi:hypothetical protein